MQAEEARALIDRLEAEAEPAPRSTASVLITPKWLGALVVVLAVVGAFVGLGWWQLGRAYTPGDDGSRNTETPVALGQVLAPADNINGQAVEQRVTLSGTLIPGTATVIGNRVQGGQTGYWVIAGLVPANTDGVLPVGLGWVESADAGRAIASDAERIAQSGENLQLTGRLLPYDGLEIVQTTAADYIPQYLSASELINRWPDSGREWYDAYAVITGGVPAVIASESQTIDSPPPSSEGELNWLNIFYAAEWAVFALFAVYLWWRLGRDEFEQAHEQARLAHEELELLRRVVVGASPAKGGEAAENGREAATDVGGDGNGTAAGDADAAKR